MNPLERLMLEGIPQGFPPPVGTGDGPTAWFMRRERQRALWLMAHDSDGVESNPQIVDAGVDVGGMPDTQNMSNRNESLGA